MRILYVHNSADIYGASRSLVRLLRSLDRTRFEPLVLLPREGALAVWLRDLGVRVIVFRGLSVITRRVFRSWRFPFFLLNIPLSAVGIARIIHREEIDLVHTNTGVILSPGPAAWLANVPHIQHIRDSFAEFRWFWPVYECWLRTLADRLVAVSEAIAAQFHDRAKVRVVHNGFDVEEFRLADPGAAAAVREKYALGDALVVGCVGRIKLRRKGQEVLLEAAARLKQRGVRAKYLLVGSPYPGNESHLAHLQQMVKTAGLEEDVIFTGEIADPRPVYGAMDVFVLPSAQPEPFGGVVMEAMCLRLPVIATAIGGSVEQVVDGGTGWLVPPGDAAALADRLAQLLADREMRARFGAAGHRRVAERFTLDGMVKSLASMYESRVRKTRKKVLLVNNSADVYGASRCLLRFVRNLDRQKFEPIVLIPGRGPLEGALAEAGVETILFPHLSTITRDVFHSWRLPPFLLRIPLSILRLRRLIRRERIDLVHTNTGVMLAPGPAAFLAGVPNVWHIRDYFQEFHTFWPLYAAYIRLFSRRILAVSTPVAEQFPRAAEVTVMHDGFELEEFPAPDPAAVAAFREKYRLNGRPVIGCVGRIKLVRKGQEYLIRAAGLLKQRGAPVQVLLVGAPFSGNESHLDRMREIAREVDVESEVTFTGEIADPRPAYATMDIAVLPSAQPEPFGGVVMEAMCLGMPVVATNVGGSIEQVADGETGFLVPPADAAALADKLERLVRDPELRQRFGAAGRSRIVERFALKAMVEKIARVYDECLNAR
jgi:glycosyltransferase involved in cell wall biosynthesis